MNKLDPEHPDFPATVAGLLGWVRYVVPEGCHKPGAIIWKKKGEFSMGELLPDFLGTDWTGPLWIALCEKCSKKSLIPLMGPTGLSVSSSTGCLFTIIFKNTLQKDLPNLALIQAIAQPTGAAPPRTLRLGRSVDVADRTGEETGGRGQE